MMIRRGKQSCFWEVGRAAIILPLLALAAAERQPSAELLAFFAPPAKYADDFGAYKSPLVFPDGRAVTTAADWNERRQQLLGDWQKLMGLWPALLDRPRIEYIDKEHRDNFTQHRLRIEIAKGQLAPGYLLVPDGKGTFPAVVIVFYEPETSIGIKGGFCDFAYQLSKRGFVTLSIGTPGGDAWKPDTASAACQPLSFHAYVAANCHTALSQLPGVDANRIGIVGHSYGGKWAMFAGALYDRFAAVAVSDPGIVFDETRPNVNYWEPWYLGQEAGVKRKPGVPSAENPRTGAYRAMIESRHDLHELHALIAPRPFLVSGGSEDPPERWAALNHAVAVNKVLGYGNRVAMTNRPGHNPTRESNEQIYLFLTHFLSPEP